MKTVGIVGLGIIGGSMAKAANAYADARVLGDDINRETLSLALLSGAIEKRLEDADLSACDFILLALPPKALVNWAKEKAPLIPRSAIVVDLCGVKRFIVSRLAPLAKEYGFSYVGGHPMAGKETSGFLSADTDLFSGASMILTPDPAADIALLETLKNFFLSLGFGRVVFTTPEEHDRMIAYTSQLAHVTSSSYIKSPTAQRQSGFSAGSFRDMTRVARLDENIWTEPFLANADNLGEEVGRLIENLENYRRAILSHDENALRALLREGRELKEKAGGR
jgi:prephenate dehydrogenase